MVRRTGVEMSGDLSFRRGVVVKISRAVVGAKLFSGKLNLSENSFVECSHRHRHLFTQHHENISAISIRLT